MNRSGIKRSRKMPTRIFIHGLESSNQGTKSVFFLERYPDMIIPHFTGDLKERMKRLEETLADASDIIIVGSSFGGLMASVFAMHEGHRVKRMILLAPAINLMHFSQYKGGTVPVPVRIYHGTEDRVIPIEDVETVAKETFPCLTFHKVEDDHFLHRTFKTIDWDSLLA
jgi:pimeloyl-ACP methyl ester carboxylesterase